MLLLGQDHYYSDISSSDINSTINGLKTLSVKQHDKAFGVTLTAKTVYLPTSGKLGAGAQIRIRLNRFTATGSHLYFPTTQKWLPVVGAEFDVFNY